MAREVIIRKIGTPVGDLGAVLTDKGLAFLLLPRQDFSQCEAWARRWEPAAKITDDSRNPHVQQLERELSSYFAGRLRDFTVSLDMRGTPFQLKVWHEVYNVGYAQIRSYSEIARSIGHASAVRAVGAANGANPIPIIVPCHRIIGSNGKLVGYGGGLDLKRRLLELEGVMFPAA